MPTPEEEHELAALADGSLPPQRRAAAERRAAASAEAQAALAEQRRAVAAVRALSESAPPELRERIGSGYAGAGAGAGARGPDRGRRGPWLAGGLARAPIGWGLATGAAAVAAVVILLFALPTGGPGAPSAAAAAALAVRSATAPASRTMPPSAVLRVRAAGVPYPDWSSKYGWRPVGMRTDGIGDRTATTVVYGRGAQTIAYTIVSGAPLPLPARAAPQSHEGTTLHLFQSGVRTVVDWTRLGHTCLLSSAWAPAATLVDLAAWRGGGAIPF